MAIAIVESKGEEYTITCNSVVIDSGCAMFYSEAGGKGNMVAAFKEWDYINASGGKIPVKKVT